MFTGYKTNVVADRPPTPVNDTDGQQPISEDRLISHWLFAKSPRTQEAYRGDLRQFRDLVRDGGLFHVTLDDMVKFTQDLKGRGFAQSTIYRKQRTIKSLYDFASAAGHITTHPFPQLGGKPGRDTLSERILSEEEVQRLLAAYGPASESANSRPESQFSWRNSLLLHVLYYSGARVAEIAGLRWRDVQPTPQGGQLAVTGKGSRSRSIPIPGVLFDALRRYRAAGFSDVTDDHPVFESRFRRALRAHSIWMIVVEAARIADIGKKVSPHWFRHSHASHALDRGVPIHTLKETLGHASLMATERYCHARPGASSADYLTPLPDDAPETPTVSPSHGMVSTASKIWRRLVG